MVMNNHSWEEQTRKLMSEAQSELKSAEEQIKVLQNKCVTLARTVNAYETALHDYLQRTGQQEASDWKWVKQLSNKNLTHKKRLIMIAEHNGGKIRISQASHLLYNKKIINSKKHANAYIIVQGILHEMEDSGIFKKINPGEYELVGYQQVLEESLPK